MRIVVGLGNPGYAYADTRHNVGFMVVEELARRWHLVLEPAREVARIALGVVADSHTLLMEPQLYMNRSGAALAMCTPSAIGAAALIVVHDELDLELGRVRVKRGGGTAGHRGVDSIAEHYGAEFTRVRIGIDRPARGTDVAEYALSPFEPTQRPAISAAVARAADAVECVLREGEEKAMNRFNTRASGGTDAAPAPKGRN